jgi:hypothetical protein
MRLCICHAESLGIALAMRAMGTGEQDYRCMFCLGHTVDDDIDGCVPSNFVDGDKAAVVRFVKTTCSQPLIP